MILLPDSESKHAPVTGKLTFENWRNSSKTLESYKSSGNIILKGLMKCGFSSKKRAKYLFSLRDTSTSPLIADSEF